MSFLNVGATVRIREIECVGKEDRLARGVVVETREIVSPEFKIWWDDGFESNWFMESELEPANDSELSLRQFGDA